jgi:hypothetical protein
MPARLYNESFIIIIIIIIIIHVYIPTIISEKLPYTLYI